MSSVAVCVCVCTVAPKKKEKEKKPTLQQPEQSADLERRGAVLLQLQRLCKVLSREDEEIRT